MFGLAPVCEDKDRNHAREVDHGLPERTALRWLWHGCLGSDLLLFLLAEKQMHQQTDDDAEDDSSGGSGDADLHT